LLCRNIWRSLLRWLPVSHILHNRSNSQWLNSTPLRSSVPA
jgi:hypothetical protein